MKLDPKIVIIDARPAGVSGDKYLGALLDLGGKAEVLRKVGAVVVKNLPGSGVVKVDVRKVERGEIGGQLVTIESSERTEKRKGVEVLHSAEKIAGKLGLSEWGSRFAVSTVETLLEAESKVHAHSRKEVELHELGSADTLVDVLGVASLAESIGLADANWWSTPVAVGRGTTTFSNKAYPVPPPAVAEILRQNHFPVEQGSGEAELTTPTGAAITVNLVGKYSMSHPSYFPEKIGYGAGSKEIEGVSNVLRLTVGRRLSSQHMHDDVVILETNVDDVSGEIIGHTVERLMSSGARDVTVTPVLMKKSRPGHILSVIASSSTAERLAGIVFEETGTLGIREIPVRRHISNREIEKIELKLGSQAYKFRAKVARSRDGGLLRAKPEYEDLKRIAEETGMSLRILSSKAEKAAEDAVSKKS